MSWHEYFQPADVIAKEADAFREYLAEFPTLQESVKSFMITEWNEAWWPNRPQDHELGAAWCADGMIRTMIPKKIDRPCLFYVKQGDMGFRGDWSIMMQDNRPKPTYNMARIFNSLHGEWVKVSGGDDDVCAVAAWDSEQNRLAIVLVNFRYRFSARRHVHLDASKLPASLAGGKWQESVIDSLHSNVFTDPSRCELEISNHGDIEEGRICVRSGHDAQFHRIAGAEGQSPVKIAGSAWIEREPPESGGLQNSTLATTFRINTKTGRNDPSK